MRKPVNYILSIAGVATGVVISSASQLHPELSKYFFWGGIAITAISIATLLLLEIFNRRESRHGPSRSPVSDYSIHTGAISGTSHRIGHDFYRSPPQRHLSNELKEALLEGLPNDRSVNVMGMNGDTESMNFANQIHSFLSSNGYNLSGDQASSHMFFDPPTTDINVSSANDGTEWWIVVGPAA